MSRTAREGGNLIEQNLELADVQSRLALTVKQVARQLNVSTQLVRLEIRREMLPAVRVGRRILVLRKDLAEYLAARRAQ